MQKIPHSLEPAAYPAIEQAFHTARQLPVWKRAPVKVGVCLRDGSVAATAVLEDYRQTRLFAIHLEAMGYIREATDIAPGPLGCDLLFKPRSAVYACGARVLEAAGA